MGRLRIIDGVEVPYTPEEERELDRQDAEYLALVHKIEQEFQKKKLLEEKFKDPFQALEKLCKHLNIDFEKLE